MWVTAQGLAPVVVVVGSAIFILGRTHGDRRRWEFAFMLAALVAFVGLVQFPFGAGIYFLYVAPLVGLAAVAVAGRSRTHDDPLTVALAAACALFGAAYLDRASLANLGWEFGRDGQSEVLDADRPSIRVYPGHAERLREIVRIVRAHSGPGAIYAGPDFPELYFLADRENPTRSLFDFLDTSGSARGQALLRTLRNEGVTAVAINRTPAFSKPLAPATVRALEAMYPNRTRLGAIDVRWAERPHRMPAGQ